MKRVAYSTLSVLALGLAACGDAHEARVETVMEGGAGREEALLELLLGKGEVLSAVLPRMADSGQPLRGRLDLVELVWKLHVRESDPRILPALVALLDDPQEELRRAAARALGTIGKEDLVHPLLDRLEREGAESVQLELLKAIELADEWKIEGNWLFKIHGGEAFSPAERARFVDLLQRVYRTTAVDSLRNVAEEFLEKIAGQVAAEALEEVTRADLDGARALYDKALAIKPDSKNVHTGLGKFDYFNGAPEQGLARLAAHGMALRVPRVKGAPVVDGALDDPVWAKATRLGTLYQNVLAVRPVLAEGRAEFYICYGGDALYLGLKAYDGPTSGLVANHRTRDSNVWQDDGIELYLDTDMDQRSYWQIVANHIGTILDAKQSQEGGRLRGGSDWNGDYQLATRIEPDYWSIEVALPFAEVEAAGVGPGIVWGFNMTWVRIGNGAEHAQFAPTYGRSLRPWQFGVLVFE